jgi:hypothetical protein
VGEGGGALRGIGGLLWLVRFHEQVGDSPCAFPIDNHREQFAIDIHVSEPDLAVFAHFDPASQASHLARILRSRSAMSYFAAVASGLP